MVCAFLSLLPQALCVVYATLLWSTREAEVLLMFAGQLACEAINFVLKRLIKEERPRLIVVGNTEGGGGVAVGKGYGMPSSHAQFTAFWAVALSLFLLIRHRPLGAARVTTADAARKDDEGRETNESTFSPRPGRFAALNASIEKYQHSPWSLAQRAVVSAGAIIVAAAVAGSRVYLGYHTVRQVVAGSVAGAGCAAAWFAVTYLMRETGMLAWALELPLARWFRLRDLVVGEDFCQAGWEKWEVRRQAALEEERRRLREKEKKAQ
jgi:dolichyldiphosphatase|uniref:Dolichyldiphosphatase n=2 Tax=Humicola insolens TaxID=85995 RepID=A0A346DKQ1_HUMIN